MEFPLQPAQPPVEVSRSEGSDIAVKTSLLLYIAFAVSLGIIGLLASYFLFASPAWTADYGIALTGNETFSTVGKTDKEQSIGKAPFDQALGPEQAESVLGQIRSGKTGALIEFFRLVIIAAVFYFLVTVAVDNKVIRSLGIPPPFTKEWYESVETKVLLSLAFIVLIVLAYYHFQYAPWQLETNPKYWFQIKNSDKLWGLVPSPTYGHNFWTNWMKTSEAASIMKAHTLRELELTVPEKVILFYLPYAGYFLYSLATFLLIATPALIVSVRAIRHFTSRTYKSISALDMYLSNKEILKTITREEIADKVKPIKKALLEDLWFFMRVFVLVLAAATFDNLWGRLTLAPVALGWAALVVILFLCTVLIPAYAFYQYDLLGGRIRSETVADDKDVPTGLDVLLEKENQWRIIRSCVVTAALVAINAIFRH
jgi:hypothetical protein